MGRFALTWRAFRREMRWWVSSLDLASTAKYNLAARWLLRQTGIVRQRGEEFNPEDLAYKPAEMGIDPTTNDEIEITPPDYLHGLNKLLDALESINGQTVLDKRGELRSQFYLELQRKPGERLSEFCTRFRTLVADLQAEQVHLPASELGWFLKNKIGLDPLRRQLLETALQGREEYNVIEAEVLRLFKDLHLADPLHRNRSPSMFSSVYMAEVPEEGHEDGPVEEVLEASAETAEDVEEPGLVDFLQSEAECLATELQAAEEQGADPDLLQSVEADFEQAAEALVTMKEARSKLQELRKDRGFGKPSPGGPAGGAKNAGVPAARKASGRHPCFDCNQHGHWAGDKECPKPGAGLGRKPLAVAKAKPRQVRVTEALHAEHDPSTVLVGTSSSSPPSASLPVDPKVHEASMVNHVGSLRLDQALVLSEEKILVGALDSISGMATPADTPYELIPLTPSLIAQYTEHVGSRAFVPYRWRRFVLRTLGRAFWHARSLLLWLAPRSHLRYLPFPYPAISSVTDWKLQAQTMVDNHSMSRRHHYYATNRNLYTAEHLQELSRFRDRVGWKFAFLEDMILQTFLLTRQMKGHGQRVKQAALDEARERARQETAVQDREILARQMIGPRGGLPPLRADLVRLALLLNVEVDAKDTIANLQKKIRPIVDILKQKNHSGEQFNLEASDGPFHSSGTIWCINMVESSEYSVGPSGPNDSTSDSRAASRHGLQHWTGTPCHGAEGASADEGPGRALQCDDANRPPGRAEPAEWSLRGCQDRDCGLGLSNEIFMATWETVMRAYVNETFFLEFTFPHTLATEVFTDTEPVARAIRRRGLHAGDSLTLSSGWDLRLQEDQIAAFEVLKRTKPYVVVLAFPCGPWSSLQFLNPAANLAGVREEALSLIAFAIRVAEFQVAHGRRYVMENPRNSMAWRLPTLQDFVLRTHALEVILDMCCFNLRSGEQQTVTGKNTRSQGDVLAEFGNHLAEHSLLEAAIEEVISAAQNDAVNREDEQNAEPLPEDERIATPLPEGVAQAVQRTPFPQATAKALARTLERAREFDEGERGTKRPAEDDLPREDGFARPSTSGELRPSEATAFEALVLDSVQLECLANSSTAHPLVALQAQVDLDRWSSLEAQEQDHGTWDGRWAFICERDWNTIVALGLSLPCGEEMHESYAVQAARKEYAWSKMSATDKKLWGDAAVSGWQVYIDNAAVQVLSLEEQVSKTKKAKPSDDPASAELPGERLNGLVQLICPSGALLADFV
ncbi:Uncharacterized protein SCF082_LOCUS49440 [Durusdinium trenchii]|uniref:Uncharacterized protein n=1 Tax=Durusdinium trenchii TaxID=1381693 RepID=A0ABP0S1G2_9DINO